MIEQGSPTDRGYESGDDTTQPGAFVRKAERSASEVLRILIDRERGALFSDTIVARTAAMVTDLGEQLLEAGMASAEAEDEEAVFAQHCESLNEALTADIALLNHVHALAVESVLCDLLEQRADIDPVLPPLIEDVLLQEGELAAAGMHLLAAQARFLHASRRMELSLQALSPDLVAKAMEIFQDLAGIDEAMAEHAQGYLSQHYDATTARAARISQLHALLQRDGGQVSSLEEAGASLFAHGLAHATNTARDEVVLALMQNDPAHLSDLLRAADWPLAHAQQALAILHPHDSPMMNTPSGDRREQA